MSRVASIPTLFAITFVGLSCSSDVGELIYTTNPPTWFEDGWSYYDVSSDATLALFGARFGFRLYDLATGQEDPSLLRGALDEVATAVFYDQHKLARQGPLGGETGWFLDGEQQPQRTAFPGHFAARFNSDGSRAAIYLPTEGNIHVEIADGFVHYMMDGLLTGAVWAPDGATVFALNTKPNGLALLLAIHAESRVVDTIMRDLDATPRFNSIGVSPDGRTLYLALAGPLPPDPESRHRPDVQRDMDLYALDLESKALRVVVDTDGDDFYPVVADGHLYWTHNALDESVVVVPASGGPARLVVAHAQIPYWNHDGTQIGFTTGGWRIGNWALNMDASVIGVDTDARPTGEASPIVVGHHEDFTPAWSPNGEWIAYHSHRSADPVPFYASEANTDDIYIRRTGASADQEIRVTDFGWEVGVADWSPDGSQLVFDSWERGGTPGISKPWIATIDTATGQPTDITRLPLPPEMNGTLFLSWAPDGNEIAAIERVANNSFRQALWILSVDGAYAQRLLEFDASTYGGLDWTPDGTRIIYSALAGERMQLFALPRIGGDAQQLTDDDVGLIHPQVSPDGRWIAASRLDWSKELRRVQLR